MPEIRTVAVAKRRRKDGLLKYASNVCSQSGEDGIIAAIFGALDDVDRILVDVGAWDGVHLSNTNALLVPKKKWSGLLIEADPKRFGALKALHEPLGNATVRALVSCGAKSHHSLPSILKRQKIPTDFDLLSIDIDGADFWLFKATLEAGYRPKVAIVEFNPTIPHDVIFVQDRDDRVRQGSSLAALDELATSFGYRLAETTTYNGFFIRNDIYTHLVDKGLCHADTSIADLHDLTMGTTLYQLYDGTLKLAGCKKLLWHRRPLDESKIQHLDTPDRVYPFAPELLLAGTAEGKSNNNGADNGHHDDDDDDDDHVVLQTTTTTPEEDRPSKMSTPPAAALPAENGDAKMNAGGTKTAKRRARRRKHKSHHDDKPTSATPDRRAALIFAAGCGLLVTALFLRRRPLK